MTDHASTRTPPVRWGYGPAPTRAVAVYWRNAWMAAVVLLGLITVRLGELWPPLASVRPVLLSVAICGGLCLITANRHALRSATRDTHVRLAACYGAWALITVPFALYSKLAFVNVVYTFPVGLMLMLTILLCAPNRINLDRILMGFLACVTLLAGGVLARGVTEAGRLKTGAMYDPNDLAGLVAMTLPIALSLAIRSRGRYRLLSSASAIILAFTLIRTASRGGLVAVALGTITLLAGLRLSRTLVCLVGIVIGGAILWQRSPPVFRERIATLLSLREDPNVTEEWGRIALWNRGVGYFLDHPLTGMGMQNFPLAEGQYLVRTRARGAWNTAHNTLIQAFAEFGFIGGGLLTAMLGLAWRRAWPLWRSGARRGPRPTSLHRPEVLASLVAFCVSALFLSHAYSYLLFAIVALVALASRVARAEARGYVATD